MNAVKAICLGLLTAAGLSACGGTSSRSPSREELIRDWMPALIRNLSSDAPDVRRQAAFGLGNCGSLGAQAIPALTAALQDPDPKVRAMVSWALGKIGAGIEEPRATMSGTFAMTNNKQAE
jgi:hypothetical protein